MMLSPSLARVVTKLSAFAFLLLTIASAHADTLVSSLTNSPTSFNFPPSEWAASSFQTDTQAWTLISATVSLKQGAPQFSLTNLRLFSSAGDRPGTTLADLGARIVQDGGTYSLYTFTNAITNVVILNPSTTYWIGVGAVGTNGGVNVAISSGSGSFGFSGAPGASMIYSASSGAGIGDNPPSVWDQSGAGAALLFSVEATPGTAVIVPRPTLQISLVDSQNVRVTWPTNFEGFSLQFTTNLPVPAWTTITNDPSTNGGQFAQTVDTSVAAKFFRLIK